MDSGHPDSANRLESIGETSSLAWTEVSVFVPLGWHELVADALALGPCTTVAIGRTSIAAEPPPDGCEVVRTFVPRTDDTPTLRDELEARLARLPDVTGAPELAGLSVRFKELPPEDYARSWRKSWRPFRVGRLTLLPPWRVEPPPRASDVRLTIQPGGAFGSGRHASTRTCLRALDRRVRGGERILDAGTGSGVLSVAGLLLGAEFALGFDVDPVSPAAAAGLARDNGVAERCEFRTGGFEAISGADGVFDVVLANIYSDVIEDHAADLASRLAPNGWFAFSGCPAHHRERVVAAITAAGLEAEQELPRGRWHTFVGRHA